MGGDVNLPLTPQQYVDLCDLLAAVVYSTENDTFVSVAYETRMAAPDLLAALRKVRGNPVEEAEVARLDSGMTGRTPA